MEMAQTISDIVPSGLAPMKRSRLLPYAMRSTFDARVRITLVNANEFIFNFRRIPEHVSFSWSFAGAVILHGAWVWQHPFYPTYREPLERNNTMNFEKKSNFNAPEDRQKLRGRVPAQLMLYEQPSGFWNGTESEMTQNDRSL